jgi:hypothetical protein
VNLALELLRQQNSSDPEQMFDQALRQLLDAADQLERERVFSPDDILVGISRVPIMELLVDDYGIRRVRSWLDNIAKDIGED